MLSLSPARRRIGAAAIAVTTAFGGAALTLAPAAHADTVIPAGQPYTITLQMSECGVMYLGTTGTCIISLQTWMNMILGTDIAIDGVYGPQTLAAVEEWQTMVANTSPSLGIDTTGHFGPKSRWALAQWYMDASDNGEHAPCILSTGQNCDPGAVDEAGLGPIGTVICVAAAAVTTVATKNEKAGAAVDASCSVTLG
jgi:hypothetical protein